MKRIIALLLISVLFLSGCSFFPLGAEITTAEPIYATDVNGEFVPIHKDVEESKLDPKLFIKDDNGRMIYADSSFSVVTGIDVSVFQGDIDWNRVKEDGIDFVMLRAGFRGYGSKGIMEEDGKFRENYNNAKKAGIDVGAYFYSQAINESEAREEARFVLDIVKDMQLDYPIAYDWEYVDYAQARTDNMTSEEITLCAKAFCEEIKSSGRDVIIYFNREIGYFEYDLNTLKDIDFWLAEYSDYPTFIYKFIMWQYTDKGVVDGIEAGVDMNVFVFPSTVSADNTVEASYEAYG